MDVVQTVHEQLRQSIEMHKESKVADPLLISKEQVAASLKTCGISEQHLSKFNVDFDEAFGFITDPEVAKQVVIADEDDNQLQAALKAVRDQLQ